jgi:hypothetical protein
MLYALQLMKNSFSYINEKPAYTYCILYLIKTHLVETWGGKKQEQNS